MEEERNLKKELGYRLYALIYRISCLFPLRQNQVFSIMTHDPSENGNVRRLERYMKKQQVTPPYRFTSLTKGERNQMTQTGGQQSALLSFFLKKPWQMARAEYILMDNAFLPMAYLHIRRRTKVVQLWHGTGTIKKFGQDATKGWLHEKERRINQNITHLIVNAPALIEQYAQAFAVPPDRTYATGLPRTDALIEQIRQQEGKEKKEGLLESYPQLSGKKLLLYAPTWRDTEQDAPRLHVDIETLCQHLPKDYAVLLRLHPFVAEAYEKQNKKKIDRCCLVSEYPDLIELMCCSDALITDYSSIIFDYVLLNKPIYFCTDDLQVFSDSGRGFYQPYESFVPGPVTSDAVHLAEQIRTDCASQEKWRSRREEFTKHYYEKQDGRAAERIYELIAERK